jgi:hypothetical protein
MHMADLLLSWVLFACSRDSCMLHLERLIYLSNQLRLLQVHLCVEFVLVYVVTIFASACAG